LTDIEFRRLPNWLTSAVAFLYSLFVMTSPTPVDWVSACIVASLVFGFGFVTFSLQLLGGGDVKLMSGLALWAGPDHLVLFLIVTSLAGGFLAILAIIIRQADNLYLGGICSSISELIANKLDRLNFTALSRTTSKPEQSEVADSLPYGVAIAAGGFAVIYALQQL
jgi:prepilin peptidase CpaA